MLCILIDADIAVLGSFFGSQWNLQVNWDVLDGFHMDSSFMDLK
jgi:hypothetical protein